MTITAPGETTHTNIDATTQVRNDAATVALAIHGGFRHLDEADFYPAHDKRKESSAYAAVHHDLVIVQDLPCLVCGVRASTLHAPDANPFGAKQMETHHHVVEWALANALDPDRFNRQLRPALAHRHPATALYQRDMSVDEIHAWVDHSPDNLWVLCNVHHRSNYVGIHAITYPLWVAQDLYSAEFLAQVQAQIDARHPAGGA
jgi:hypothetical protein